jgi:hypothetical protein
MFRAIISPILRSTRLCLQLAVQSMSVRLSVRPHGSVRLPLDGYSWNFEDFSKICLQNSSFIKIWQEQPVLYLRTNTHFWSYLAHIILEWEMFRTKFVEKIKTHGLCSVTFFSTSISYRMWDYAQKFWRVGQATDDNMAAGSIVGALYHKL